MGRPALTLVAQHPPVVKATKPEPRPDPVFFIKRQIHVGAHLIHLGRRQSPTTWVVTRIISHDTHGRPRRMHEVDYLSDRVYLKRANGPSSMAERSATFSYLSYSAIWRIG